MSFPVFFLPASVRALCAAALFALATGPASADAPFVDNGNGTVTDTSTGLMWDQCALGLSGNGLCTTGAATLYSWSGALGQAATQSTANYKGYSDWRLPSIVELQTLVKLGVGSPTIDSAAFPNTVASDFWSGSSYVPGPVDAWGVYFDVGYTYAVSKLFGGYVRLVRGGQYFGPFALLSGGAVSGVTTSTATLSATSPVAATGYWLVVPRGATPPTPAQVVAGVNYGSVTIAGGGNAVMTAKTEKSFAMTSLSAGTAYDLYLVAKESATGFAAQLVGPIQFSTLAISTTSIVIDPATPATLYSALDGGGVYKKTASTDWTAATTQPANTRIKALVIKPGVSAVLFAATYGGGAFKSSDSGVNWSACATQPANLNLLSLTMDAAGKLYAGSEAGVFVSSDSCANWSAMSTGLPPN